MLSDVIENQQAVDDQTFTETTNRYAENSVEQLSSPHSDAGSGFLGFEWFDLIVVVCQAMFFLFALPLDQFLLHSVTKFVGGIGFFVSLYFLGRTREYLAGFQQIRGIHQYLHLATTLGGFFSGLMVCLLVFVPIADLTRHWKIDPDLVTFLLVLPGLMFAVLLPWLSSRAEENNEDTEWIQCPAWLHLVGRGFILLVANIMLIHVYRTFQGEAEGDLLGRAIICSFAMCMFYIPIRVQELFLRHEGPHFQSLIQTTLALIFCGSISPFV